MTSVADTYPAGHRKPSTKTTLAYAVGSIAYGVKDQGFQGLLLIYYNQVLGLSALNVSLALMVALVADAVLDPLIGHVSDNCRAKLGRRHVFMFAAILPAAVSVFAVWNPPKLSSDAFLFAYLVVTLILARFSMSLFEIPNAALLPELTQDYDVRTTLLSLRYLFGILGAFGIAIVVFAWVLAPSPGFPNGQLNPAGYFKYSVLAVSLIVLAMIISTLGTASFGRSFRAKTTAIKPAPLTTLEFASIIRSRPLLAMLGFGMASGLANGLSTAMGVYFGTYYWHLASSQMAVLAAAALAGTLASAILAPALARKMDKRTAALLLLAVGMIMPTVPLLLNEAALFPEDVEAIRIGILLVERFLSVAAIMGAVIVGASMSADIVEAVEAVIGRRTEGLLQGMSSFVAKTVSGLGIWSAGALLTLVSFPEKSQPTSVPTSVLSDLALSYVLIMACANLAAMICLKFYPITRRDHERRIGQLKRSC